MGLPRLHDDQIDVPDALVARLVAEQFPDWASLTVRPMPSAGTINRVDLLGDSLVVRMPFIEWGASDVARDRDLLPRLAEALPVAVPRLIATGAPAHEMPWEWGVYELISGRHPRPGPPDDVAVATGLVSVVRALRELPADGPVSPAVFDFGADDEQTRPKVDALGSAGASAAWEAAVKARPWNGDQVWIHGDLVPGNLLLRGEPARLTAVLDWAAAGIGDPAFDLLPAWMSMGPEARDDFLAELDASDDQIARARGYAVRKIAWGLPYYRDSLPAFADALAQTLRQVAADLD